MNGVPIDNLIDFIWVDRDWLYSRYRHLEFVRSQKYPTFKAALNLFLQGNGRTIVETGTMRLHEDPGGSSTLLFGAFCSRYGKKLYTVDINPMNVKVSMDETKEFKDNITYVVSDSVEFLKKFREPIHLLYLDSKDCPLEGDATEAQEHQRREYEAAEDNLHKGSILLCDDSNYPNGGKTRLLKRHLQSQPEWVCILDWGQMLWWRVE